MGSETGVGGLRSGAGVDVDRAGGVAGDLGALAIADASDDAGTTASDELGDVVAVAVAVAGTGAGAGAGAGVGAGAAVTFF